MEADICQRPKIPVIGRQTHPPVSGGEPHLPDFLKGAPEIWLWREAHGSISVQERQPNLVFRRFGFIARTNKTSGSCGFRKLAHP
jgi:hypothetical protein